MRNWTRHRWSSPRRLRMGSGSYITCTITAPSRQRHGAITVPLLWLHCAISLHHCCTQAEARELFSAFDQAATFTYCSCATPYTHIYIFTQCQDDSGSISRDELTQALETIDVMALNSAQATFCFQPTPLCPFMLIYDIFHRNSTAMHDRVIVM